MLDGLRCGRQVGVRPIFPDVAHIALARLNLLLKIGLIRFGGMIRMARRVRDDGR